MAPPALLVLSLWASIFPVPLAGARWGRDVGPAARRTLPEDARHAPVVGCSIHEITVSQSFTFIDPAGNRAQYTVYEADWRNQFQWSTDHGDRGSGDSYVQAQSQARIALKASMSERRKLARRQ